NNIGTVGGDGTNTVFFRTITDPKYANSVAVTYWWWLDGVHITDFDTIFNDPGYGFDTGNVCSHGGFFVQAVATHELGHALGLQHSNVAGATMWPSGSGCDPSLETLESDDIAGIQSLYPQNKPDSIGPGIWFASPLNGAVLSNTVPLSVFVFDNYSVSKVEY